MTSVTTNRRTATSCNKVDVEVPTLRAPEPVVRLTSRESRCVSDVASSLLEAIHLFSTAKTDVPSELSAMPVAAATGGWPRTFGFANGRSFLSRRLKPSPSTLTPTSSRPRPTISQHRRAHWSRSVGCCHDSTMCLTVCRTPAIATSAWGAAIRQSRHATESRDIARQLHLVLLGTCRRGSQATAGSSSAVL